MLREYDMQVVMRIDSDVNLPDSVINEAKAQVVRSANEGIDISDLIPGQIKTCYFAATLSDGEVAL